MSDEMTAFAGDLSGMWTLQNRPPLHHLTWDWWWWLVMIEDPDHPEPGKQLMVLWSTKDNEMVQINDVNWNPTGKPGFDKDGAIRLDGMVCAWWFDGSEMHDEIISKVCEYDRSSSFSSFLAISIKVSSWWWCSCASS